MFDFSNIKTILIEWWDPLDISENKNLHDEYDSIVRDIERVKIDSSFIDNVRDLLVNSERKFELEPIDIDRINRVVNILYKLIC